MLFEAGLFGLGWALTPIPSIKMTDNVKNTFFLIFRSIFCGLFFLWFDGCKNKIQLIVFRFLLPLNDCKNNTILFPFQILWFASLSLLTLEFLSFFMNLSYSSGGEISRFLDRIISLFKRCNFEALFQKELSFYRVTFNIFPCFKAPKFVLLHLDLPQKSHNLHL